MLKLDNIKKIYDMGDLKVEALKGVSVEFRKSEFVSILGPSGCGKTTLLNIIGGLDRYTDGDIVINGTSTKEFKDKEWDTYRNHSIGFVFQSYNLIPHQTVLENVELALTLSGVSKEERKQRATAVLERVGLGDKLKNRPNQLSGGQMQRVAIARALVNDPEIILADEPTGALDTGSSVQIMEILKEISKDRLIIMVTHNPELAEEYSTRIVRLLDGELIADSNPFTEKDAKKEAKLDTRLAHEIEADEKAEKLENKQEEAKAEDTAKLQATADSTAEEAEPASTKKSLAKNMQPLKKNKKKRMSFFTALALSFKNLLTKKARTFLVAFAGSIGIIGIALILSISSGFSTYVNKMQEDTLSNYPITIKAKSIDFTSVMLSMFTNNKLGEDVTHDKDAVYDKDSISSIMNSVGDNLQSNNLTKFKKYIEDNYAEIKPYVNAIQYTYDMDLEFYKNATVASGNEISDLAVEPNSNALTNMIVKYALFYFEDKTHYEVTKQDDGTYLITTPAGVQVDNTFLSQYTALADLKSKLETNGTATLNYVDVVKLAFTLIGFGDALTTDSSGSSEMSSAFSSMSVFNEMIDNDTLIKSQYTLLSGKFAENANEAILVLDKNNELDEYILYSLGIMSDEKMDALLESKVKKTNYDAKMDYSDIVDKCEYKILEERDYWIKDPSDNSKWFDFRVLKPTDKQLATASATLSADPSSVEPEDLQSAQSIITMYQTYLSCYKDALNNSTNTIKIVGIVRLNDNAETGSLKSGVAYRGSLTTSMIDYHNESEALGLTSSKNAEDAYSKIDKLTPESINIYVTEFESKAKIQAFIDKYNSTAENGDEISYTDYAGMIMSTVSGIIDAITYVLIAFVSVSLIVSSIMIGIITYISVIERTKEIGVLRSIGASKKDVKRVFTAESFIIGLASGVFGITVSFLLTIPINLILKHFTGIAGLAKLPISGALILVAISVILTFIAGLLPAKMAAKKDPVIALRAN